MKDAISQVYESKEKLIIIGLTGRTGSGCSKVAEILETSKFEDLHMKSAKSYDYKSSDERKFSIIYDYMKEPGRWFPFSVIEVSSLIFASAFESGIEEFIKFIDGITDDSMIESLHIGEKDKFIDQIRMMSYVFVEAKKYSLSLDNKNVEGLSDIQVEEYYKYYMMQVKKEKKRFRDVLDEHTCYYVYNDETRGKQQSKYHLYTYLMQKFGNNIRCSGDPFVSQFDEKKYNFFAHRIDNLIKIISKYNEIKGNSSTRICIDAIRNPYESIFLRDKYRAFYLMAVGTDDSDRRNRLSYLTLEEQKNLDNIEYPEKTKEPEGVFYHQSIEKCIEYAGIHVYNPSVTGNKYYELTEQLIKYIALIIHPGLVTPSHIERCMQLAYNTKFNSGCLSRQVGAVVTRADYSVQSVGWNDVPKGQIPCMLRDVQGYCKNRDGESFSKFELEDNRFSEVMQKIDNKVENKLCGRKMTYCFKDVYNGMTGDKNQVYTRALHAEENAFLQISKYGGSPVMGGNLFTTASPCELCAKKAYQLGIKNIYYINPYPGISYTHILSFGKKNNPCMNLFFGAIGQTYLELYEPRIAVKDELELLTEESIKKIAQGEEQEQTVEYGDIEYESVCIDFQFANNRSEIECYRSVEAKILAEELCDVKKSIVWTGSSYDGTELVPEESDEDIRIEQTTDFLPYTYTIKADRKQDNKLKYKVVTKVKDEKQVMSPYLAHKVRNKTRYLELKISSKHTNDIFENVTYNVYADLEMKTLIESKELEIKDVNDVYVAEVKIDSPNVNYTYAINWKFKKNSLEKFLL